MVVNQLARQVFRQPAGNQALVAQVALIAHGYLGTDIGLLTGLQGGDVDDATHRVASKQGALGTAQYFDTLNVEHFLIDGRDGAHVHAVEEHHHRVIHTRAIIGGTDSAHGNNGLPRGKFSVGHTRHTEGNFRGTKYLGIIELVATDGRHRHPDILQVFLAVG